MVARIASSSDSMKRSRISSEMGAPVHMERPKSKRASPHIHSANCRHKGRSRPKRARSWSSCCLEANELSPEKRSSTTSPGTTRIRKKMSAATPTSVGIISRKRLAMYRAIDRPPCRPAR